uniref:Major capsid protein N-terminal domain-containing protein n=1 Tax=viral metagenome TaxID=1070528 RepID=A0A6C0IVF3_9ZZZZ
MSNSSGALTELAALGNQDAFLSINPEKTFFAQSYRRHTNFAIAEQDITLDNAPSGQWTQRKVTARVPRNGDLLGWCYFSCVLSALGLDAATDLTDTAVWGLGNLPASIAVARQETRIYWANAVGHAMISEVTFEVGSQVVDKWNGEFLQLWESLTGQPGKRLKEMIGYFDAEEDLRDFAAQSRRLYVPLPFYFCRAYALHKPLIALQYHETKIQVSLLPRENLIVRFRGGSVDAFRANLLNLSDITGGEMSDAAITANYVYLDTMERRVFAQQPHEYLITQLQIHGKESVPAGTASKQVQIHFNHPVLELYWVYQEDSQRTVEEGFRYFNYGVELGGYLDHQDPTTAVIPLVDPIDTVSLQLNGHDRIATRGAFYFRSVQPWERHTNIPERFIYNYNFGLYPEEDWSPSGALNMSRIDNVVFRFSFVDIGLSTGLANAGQLSIYGRSHNVVKIETI